MLADAANAVSKWMDDLAVAEPGVSVDLIPATNKRAVNLIRWYLSKGDMSNLFSSDPPTMKDEKLYMSRFSARSLWLVTVSTIIPEPLLPLGLIDVPLKIAR